MPQHTEIYNDNEACVCWSNNMTRLRKASDTFKSEKTQFCKSIQSNVIDVLHIAGKINLADLFTKEDKDAAQFIAIRDIIMTPKQGT